MTLLIATPGPQLTAATVPGARDAWPALPVLSGLLTRARRLEPAASWQSGVLAGIGAPAGIELPHAAIAIRALPFRSAGMVVCFATPLHLVAGISRVHLPPGGCLQLDSGESMRWTEAFNLEFGSPQLRLHPVNGGWLLEAPFAMAARDGAPDQLLGEPLARDPAQGEAGRALRRLGAEVEIWLASHPLNREREARSLPPFNCLWFWGGAQVSELAPLKRPPAAIHVAGSPDAWLEGLAAYASAPLLRVSAWDELVLGSDALLVLVPSHERGVTAHWQGLEGRWYQPAAAALRQGRLDALRLQIGRNAWQLPDSSPLRWLRMVRPWHRQVSP